MAGTVAVGVLIWFPQWTIGAAFALACLTEIFPRWLGDLQEDTNTESLGLFAVGAALTSIEILVWYFLYRGEVPFSNLMFPTPDSPYDLRLIFLGWLMMFQATLSKLRQFFIEDSN